MTIIGRLLLRKSDVLAAYNGVGAAVAADLGCTRQNVSAWGRFVPEIVAYKLLDLKPELRDKAIHGKPRRRPYRRHS